MKKILLVIVLLMGVHFTGLAQKHSKPTAPSLTEETAGIASKTLTDFTSHITPNSYGKRWAKVKDEWARKVTTASTAEAFGKTILMLAKNLDQDAYKDSWDGIRSSWSDKAEKAKSLKQLATLYKQLESHLKPTAYDEAWAPLREAWVASLTNMK